MSNLPESGIFQCCGSMKFWYGSGGSWTYYFRQWASRRQQKFFFFLNFLAYYFLKVHFHQFSKIIKKSKNSRNRCFSAYFCLMIEGSGSGAGPDPYLWLMDPDPRGPKIYGSSDPDPGWDTEGPHHGMTHRHHDDVVTDRLHLELLAWRRLHEQWCLDRRHCRARRKPAIQRQKYYKKTIVTQQRCRKKPLS